MIPPVPETPNLETWLTRLSNLETVKASKGNVSIEFISAEAVAELVAELPKLVRTAQREAAERGFREGFIEGRRVDPDSEPLTWEDVDTIWAASALHAELEDPT